MNLILNKLLVFQITLILFFSIKISWSRIIDESIFKKRDTVNNDVIIEYLPNYQLNDYNFTLFSKNIPIKYMNDEEKKKLKDELEDYVEINSLVTSAEFSFYNQLTDDEKYIYDTIYSESTKVIPELEISIKISNIKNLEDYFNELSTMTNKVFRVLIDENPELWWIGDCGYGATLENYSTVIITYILNYPGTRFADLSASQISDLNKEIDQVKNKIMNQIAQTGLTTSYAILRYIHDYLITKIVYTLDESRKHIRNIYGALVEEKCVCEGYAEAFQYLARQYNINCIIARSMEHEWNFVEMDGKWYVVDVTYDDPLISGRTTPSGSNDNLKLNYFLTGTEHVYSGNKKYSTDPDHVLTYSPFPNAGNIVYYPSIEENDYIPTNKELNELELIDYTFPDIITNKNCNYKILQYLQ